MTVVNHARDTGNSVEVTTAAGTLRGVWRDRSAAFLGIPFAAPPVGPRRFLAPAPAEPWSGVRDATAYGPTPQRRPFGDLTTIPEPSFPGEDTLNVNVFTPAPGDREAALPVFVWIHGGGYFAGSPSSPWYDGISFNHDGIVTVSVSYRLGFDGFGWIDGAPLNRGLLDQIAALQWVRDNIAAFGGDPDAVTIGGQSAGGGSVLALMASPRAAGLFRGVISQSGAIGRLTTADAEAAGRRLADLVGVQPTLDAWRRVSEDTVLDHERAVNQVEAAIAPDGPIGDLVANLVHGDPDALDLAFSPIVDGDVLPHDPLTAVQSDATSEVSLLMGTTRNEFAFPAPGDAQEAAAALRASDVDPSGYLAEIERIGDQYARGQLLTVGMFRLGAVTLARARAATGHAASTWLYDFGFHAPVNNLASHCFDLPFSWGLLRAEGVEHSLGAPLPAALEAAMHDAWAGFIRDGAAPWQPTTERASAAMRFDADSGHDPDAYAFEAGLADVRERSAEQG